MATQQRQHGLISDEYGFLVGSRRLEQGIESVDDKVQRIIEFLEKNAKPTKVVNSQTVAQNQVAKDVSKLVTLTEKSHKEIQKTKVANSQTLRNGGNIKNREANENSSLSTRPTKVVNSQTGARNSSASVGSSATELSTDQPTRTVNSQTGATNASASVGSSAAELSTNQPTRTVNSQTSQQAQNRRRDANGRFIGGEGEQSKSSGGLFKGMTQAVRNGFLQANSDGQNLDPSIDALYEVKNILSPVGRVAALTLRPLGALFKSKKRNEPLSREEEKHNKKEIKLLERIARMGGGGGGLLGGLLGRGGGLLLRMVAGPIIALAAAFFGGFKLGQIINEKVSGWINTLIEADIPKRISDLWNGFITKLSDSIPDSLKDAAKAALKATPIGAAQNAGSKLLQWGRGVANTVKSTMSEAYNDTVGGGAGDSDKTPSNHKKYAPLLNEIAKGESKGGAFGTSGYDAVYGGAKIKPPKPISQMTIGEVKAYQQQLLKSGAKSTAVGRYQFIHNKGAFGKMAAQAGLKDTDLMSPENQDKLAIHYMGGEKQLDKWIKTGDINAITNKAAQQFASMKNTRGVGNYDGDKVGNKARHGGVNVIARVVEQIKNGPKEQALTTSTTQTTTTKNKKIETPKGAAALAKFAQNAEMPTNTLVATPQKTGTPKSTALPPTISKPPVVPSLSMKPTINMKAQPIQFRSAAKVEPIPKIESVPEMHTSPKPMLVQNVNSGDNISQNLSDRGLAHLVTGGLGENRYGA